jgi:hypothetical protein
MVGKEIRLLLGCAMIFTAILAGFDPSKPLQSLFHFNLSTAVEAPETTVMNHHTSLSAIDRVIGRRTDLESVRGHRQ